MKDAVAIIQPGIRINQAIVLGLSDELQRRDEWDIHVLDRRFPLDVLNQALSDINPHAIIVRTPYDELMQLLESRSVPLVIVAHEGTTKSDSSVVIPDSEAIGKMAAEYLLAQRFEHLAYVTYKRPLSGRMRSFVHTIEGRCTTLNSFIFSSEGVDKHAYDIFGDPRNLIQWLRGLPKPCAIFAHADQAGSYLVRICVRNGIRVPEEIAVLGVDDDPFFCNTVSPNLSSIHVPNARIGIEAARMIHDWKPGRRLVQVPPTTVVERASCRPPRRDDPLVDKALEHLRRDVAKGVQVRDLQKLTGLTAHQTVYRFKIVTGHTPMEMILGRRISVAKQYLAETSLTVAEVARLSGFNSATQFYVTFRKQTGQSPRSYRAQFIP